MYALLQLQLMAKLHIEKIFLLITDELIFNCISWSVKKFFLVFAGMQNSQFLCIASTGVSFCILFVNVSLFSLNMRTGVFLIKFSSLSAPTKIEKLTAGSVYGVFLVLYCLIMFLRCALYVFSGIVDYVFKFFPLDFANKALFSTVCFVVLDFTVYCF